MPYQLRFKIPNTELEIMCSAGDSLAALHQAMSDVSDLYRVGGKCTVCGSTARPVVRSPKAAKGKFYEWWCNNMECKAKMQLHQFKEGGGLYRVHDEEFEVWDGEKHDEPSV